MNPLGQLKFKPGRFRVGDRVRLAVGFSRAEAEILEDRGPLGVGGRRFYTIRLKVEGSDDMIVDWPEDELKPFDGVDRHDNKAP
jgi:hypothetical protein